MLKFVTEMLANASKVESSNLNNKAPKLRQRYSGV